MLNQGCGGAEQIGGGVDVGRVNCDRNAADEASQDELTKTSNMEGSILTKKTEGFYKEDKLLTNEANSSMFGKSVKFGRKQVKTPRKMREEMRAKPRLTKDAARTARNGMPSQERSPGLGGRGMMKQMRCTPRKITKISRVSTLKQYFESQDSSSLTRGPIELLMQSKVAVNLNLGRGTTTTGGAENSRTDFASQSEHLIGTGPRQTAYLGLSLSQDWTSQTWARDKDQ